MQDLIRWGLKNGEAVVIMCNSYSTPSKIALLMGKILNSQNKVNLDLNTPIILHIEHTDATHKEAKNVKQKPPFWL